MCGRFVPAGWIMLSKISFAGLIIEGELRQRPESKVDFSEDIVSWKYRLSVKGMEDFHQFLK